MFSCVSMRSSRTSVPATRIHSSPFMAQSSTLGLASICFATLLPLPVWIYSLPSNRCTVPNGRTRRLVAFNGGEIVRFGSFQKFIDAVHGGPSSDFSSLYHAHGTKASPQFETWQRSLLSERYKHFSRLDKKPKILIDFLLKVCYNKTKRRKSC